MTKLRRYSKNSVNRGLLFSIFIIAFLTGCSSSTKPTFLKENIPDAIQDILKKEYKIDIKARLVGETLWIYLPVENLLEKADKPEKYSEKFIIKQNKSELKGNSLNIEYWINAAPETEKKQDIKYNKDILEKINNVWAVVRRVLFSMEHTNTPEPKFICLIAADIKNGIEIKEVTYYPDLKKVSYNFISTGEYHHRVIQDVDYVPEIIGDKEGISLNYTDMALDDFLAEQIRCRIRLKFQKPEVDKNADIDKEVAKIVVYTIKTYGFKDFREVELNNLDTNNKVILNRAAVWARPTD